MRYPEERNDDLGLSPEFLDSANYDGEPTRPYRNKGKFCMCGKEAERFDVYRPEPDEYNLYTIGQHVLPPCYGVIAIVNGHGCCSACEDMNEADSLAFAAELNEREYADLAEEI